MQHVEGSITRPTIRPPLIIAHVCNDLGMWGAGVSGAISAAFPSVEACYKSWKRGAMTRSNLDHGLILARKAIPWASGALALGELQLCPAPGRRGWWVANLCAQRGVRTRPTDPRALNYEALERCLGHLRDLAAGLGASVHIPYMMGAGLAGGDWHEVARRVDDILTGAGVSVIAYELPEEASSRRGRAQGEAARAHRPKMTTPHSSNPAAHWAGPQVVTSWPVRS